MYYEEWKNLAIHGERNASDRVMSDSEESLAGERWALWRGTLRGVRCYLEGAFL